MTTTQIPFSLINLNDSGSLTLRNKLFNGNFDVWQRATSGTVTGTGAAIGYPASDRWKHSMSAGTTGSGTTTLSGSQQIFTPGQTTVPGEPTYFQRTQATSLGTQSGTSSYIRTYQIIESVRILAGQNVTISFWAKADTNRTYAVIVTQSFGSGGSPSAGTIPFQTTFNVTSTFQKFTYTFAMPSIAGKTLGTANDSSSIQFVLYKQDNIAFGDTLGPIGTYSTTPFLDLSQVQMEKGLVVSPFEFRPYSAELLLCQRYFEKMGGQAQFDILLQTYNATSASSSLCLPFKAVKRTAPGIAKFGTWAVSNCGQPAAGVTNIYTLVINALVTTLGVAGFNTVDTTTYFTADAEF